METVGVIIATFGDQKKWKHLVDARSMPSVRKQTRKVDQVQWVHMDDPNTSLGGVRNYGASLLSTDWVIFLDADDQLDSNYVEKMLEGTGDIRQPSTLGVYGNGTEDPTPVLIAPKPLIEGNYIIVGAMCRSDIFWKAGGFGEELLFEDWALWLKMEEAGAIVGPCPEAIYRVYVNTDGRNSPSHAQSDYWYHTIKSQAMKRRAEWKSQS